MKEILLYGSYARGDNDSQSDIDFAAIVDGDRLNLQEKLTKLTSVRILLDPGQYKDSIE